MLAFFGLPEAMLIGLFGSVFCTPLLLNIIVCALLFSALRKLPRAYQRQEPGMVWLLVIPLFHLVWNFFVYPRISESYCAYFRAIGRHDVGDCAESIGLAYCICAAIAVLPGVGCAAVVAAIVLLIVYLVRLYELVGMVPADAAAQAPPAPPSPGYCPRCGMHAPGAAYCPSCGTPMRS